MTKEKKEVGFSDANEAVVNELEKKEPESFKAPKYRYFCDACTNIAFTSEKIEEGLSGVCQCCGKPYTTRKENYIKL